MKSLKMKLPLSLLLLSPAIVLAQATTVCTVTGGVLDFANDVNNNYCQGEPDYYAISVLEMGLCTSAPTPPTTTTATDFSSCEIVYSAPTGTTVAVENGASSPLSGGSTTRPSNGTYTYGYIKISKNFQVRAALTLNVAVAGDHSGAAPGVPNGTGVYCITTGVTSDGTGENGRPTYPSSTQCSNSATILNNAATNTAPLNDLGGGGGGFSATNTEGALTAYLLDTSGFLSTDNTDVNTVLGVQDFSATPIIVTADSTVMNAQFTVTQGMSVSDTAGGGGNAIGIGNGPFNVNITIE